MCMHVGVACYDTCMKMREQHAGFGFPLLSLQLSSGCQVWWRGSFPPEPSHWCLFDGDSILLCSSGLPKIRCVAKTDFKPAAALLSQSPEGCWDYRLVSAHPSLSVLWNSWRSVGFRLSLKVWYNSRSKAFGHGSQCHGFAIELTVQVVHPFVLTSVGHTCLGFYSILYSNVSVQNIP